MAELNAAAAATTSHDSHITDEVSLRPEQEAKHDGKSDRTGEGGEVVEEKRVPEEALETHEVVEINKFTERKEWIEEKIKLLESIPPIEVFAGVDTLLTLSEEIPPGLPSRAQLNHWLEEHDKTEKETEIFDAEDMSKLKTLTKAATRRNLSPEDTDLIELTLTTLLALDKLLHLLRDRSESLDLLGLRITWEEQRVTAWRERRFIVGDLEVFLSSRARWSLDTYELQPPSTPSAAPGLRFTSPSPSPSPRPSSSLRKRRDSAASLASISSDTSSSFNGPSSAVSRSTRYKLAELLSHDAALFSGRLTALNHGKVMAAGKTLDKLIDASRKPVPDEILDEQDRLEDKAVKELETIGKFALTVVMQWKRADEHYSDTMKDQFAAQALITELNNAEFHHPMARQDAAFISFPRPVHPFFPSQAASNEMIVKTLSTELCEAVKLAHQAEVAAQAYHARLEAVKWAEMLKDQIQAIDKMLEKVADKFMGGMHDGHEHGDASPPDLDKEVCLSPTQHATFLALLPSVVKEFDQADQTAKRSLRDGMAAALRLKTLHGIDATLKNDLAAAIDGLEARRDSTRQTKEEVVARAARLKEVRRLWQILIDTMDSVEDARNLGVQGMDSQRWKTPEGRRNDTPITPDPDSPQLTQVALPLQMTPHSLSHRLDVLGQQLASEFKTPLTQLLPSLEKSLAVHLQSSSDSLGKYIDDVRGLVRLWNSILQQAEAMMSVQLDCRELRHKIDALQSDVDDARDGILHSNNVQQNTPALESSLHSRSATLQESVRTFTDSLAARMPFVSRSDNPRSASSLSRTLSSFSTSFERQLDRLKTPPEIALPFDLSALDNDVRSEGNALAIRLAGGMQSLAKKFDYLHLAKLAKTADLAIGELVGKLDDSEQELLALKALFDSLPSVANQSGVDAALSQKLVTMVEQADQLAQDYYTLVARLTPPIEQSLRALQAAPGSHDSPIHGTIVLPRMRASDDALHRVDSVRKITVQLRTQIMRVQGEEETRLHLEKERLENERLERERLERERLEKERLEKERLEVERLEEERMEKERLEKETLEKERLEEERLGKERLEKERLEVERLEEERLEKERLEKERLEVERLEKERLEKERLEVERLEKERLEKERLEKERLEKERLEKERLEKTEERTRLGTERLDLRRTTDAGRRLQLDAKDQSIREEIATKSLVKPKTPDEDVFGRRLAPSTSSATALSPQVVDLRSRITALRTRLQSLSIGSLVRSLPGHNGNAHTTPPSSKEALDTRSSFTAVANDAAALPATIEEDSIVNSELQALRSELDVARAMVQRLVSLSDVCDKVAACDHALSDLLEHADTYPAAPSVNQLASPHKSDARLPCEEQLASRMAFTKMTMEQVNDACIAVADDSRAVAEQTRLQQTWSELADMCTDRINGTRSRPESSVSSTGRSSVVATASSQRRPKPSLSGTVSRPRRSESITRHRVTSAYDPAARPPTHMSNRSVSGPSGSSSLFSTTFASRQRTTSLASIQSAILSPFKRPLSPIQSRVASKRPGSPTFSERSSQSVVSSPSRSTWARAPRQSFGTLPTHDTPIKRKAYVANPRSKLDVAVGNVVNNFRLPVTIHAAGDSWKDQSGKYWIGEAEPKLCFCRILRSQTVMVRVGGGWCELSKFLKGHFADLLAELPPSPPRSDERWINAATVHEAMGSPTITARSPTTPEPKGPALLPSLHISTPNGTSPQSIKSSSSPGGGSPSLTPFQFMRRADAGLRPVTPSPTKSTRAKPTTPSVTPARSNIWRP
ncbi:hypothetical protein JB92DRAFT_3006159 [Gautieria morchelliformis]|nr:hypothetical protein JB92DRAFT_3006159 [Gautieria morchelliformis]